MKCGRSGTLVSAVILTITSLLSSELALGQSATIIPAARNFDWNPGMMSKGGVPTRTTVCATLPPGNGTTDDTARIQAAVDSCPANQVVALGAGTFVVNSPVIIHSSITLRGAGAGVTILNKANGAGGRTSTIASGSLDMPQDPF